MLTVEILCVGKLSQRWFAEGFEEYRKRLSAFDRVTVTEIPEHRASEGESARREAVQKEGEAIAKRLLAEPRALRAALCVEGELYRSEDLAQLLCRAKQTASHIFFVIGGSDGLSDEVKRLCPIRISVSRMTFPHQMMRMLLAEQLYRAETIAAGMRYHK